MREYRRTQRSTDHYDLANRSESFLSRTLPFISLLLRVIVGSILVYAGFMKAAPPPADFAAAIEPYLLFPASLITPIAFALPWIEMWVGTFLIAGFMTHESAILSSILF